MKPTRSPSRLRNCCPTERHRNHRTNAKPSDAVRSCARLGPKKTTIHVGRIRTALQEQFLASYRPVDIDQVTKQNVAGMRQVEQAAQNLNSLGTQLAGLVRK